MIYTTYRCGRAVFCVISCVPKPSMSTVLGQRCFLSHPIQAGQLALHAWQTFLQTHIMVLEG